MTPPALFDPRIGWQFTLALFHVSWLGLVFAGLAAAGNWWLREGSASLRHDLTFAALLAMGLSLPAAFACVCLTTPRPVVGPSVTSLASAATARANPPVVGVEPTPSAVPRGFDIRENSKYIALVYLAGVAAMLARLGLSTNGARRLCAACQPVGDRRLLDIVTRQCQRLGVHLVPVVACCERAAAPLVLGLVRPLILLPASMLTGLDAEELAAVLTHELAHIRRYDHLLIVVQRLIEALLFYHPAVWYLSRCIDRERENCCDDMVLAAGGDRLGYCRSLLRVAELRLAGEKRRLQLTVLAVDGDRPSWLRQRIARLLGVTDMPAVRLTRTGLVLCVVLVVLVAAGIWASLLPSGKRGQSRVQLVPERADTVAITQEGMDSLGIRVAAVQQAAPARLELRGSLALDPNRLAHVRLRFKGEVVSIGFAREPGGDAAQPRQGWLLNFGDRVQKGEVLAVVRSDELAEKGGELFDSLKRLRIAAKNLNYLQELLRKGATTEKSVRDAQREMETAEIAVAKAERTLRSWRLSNGEIQKVAAEVDRTVDGNARVQQEEILTTAAVVAPMDGVIVEKNAVVGDLVDENSDLFKIADLSVLSAWAYADEKDIAMLHSMARPIHWTLRVNSDPQAGPISGPIDRIGEIVDPKEHTALLAGPVDNAAGRLHAGQFISAAIDLPGRPSLVAVPDSALVEDGDSSVVFVESDPDRYQFVRRKVSVRRRDRTSVFIGVEPTDDERQCGIDALRAGERVIIAGASELAAEIGAAQSRSPAK
jgi:cobalt-zinc-cadmium efflux system membrane fusion protein